MKTLSQAGSVKSIRYYLMYNEWFALRRLSEQMAGSIETDLTTMPKQTTEETEIAATVGDRPRVQATAASSRSKGGEKFEMLQRVFSENFRPLTEPVKHDRTSVLILSWEKDGSDMDVSDEICELQSCLRHSYHFDVERKELAASGNPQRLLNKIISDFVLKNADPHNLCVFYYAGHGWGGETPGHLYLTNNSSQDSRSQEKRAHNHVEWHKVDALINESEGDVLVIFDCCHAGALRKYRSPPNRRYDILCAAEYNEQTPGPGINSFTSAMIWAFHQLESCSGFDTETLKEMILDAPHFQKDKQTPFVLHEPVDQPVIHEPRANDEPVWIAPHRTIQEGLENSTTEHSPKYKDERPMEFLDMRFRFSKPQDERQMKLFAQALTKFARDNARELGIHRVELNEYAPRLKDAILQLQARIRHNKLSRQSQPTVPVSTAIDKSEAMLRRRTTLAVKAFLCGIALTLLFWCIFFFAPFQRLLRTWRFENGPTLRLTGNLMTEPRDEL
ncbi:MAG: hypothetical protein Q9160_006758 [Pyrenula sp. 1 TL-2023]